MFPKLEHLSSKDLRDWYTNDFKIHDLIKNQIITT